VKRRHVGGHLPKCCVSQLHHLREDGFSLVFEKFNGFDAVRRNISSQKAVKRMLRDKYSSFLSAYETRTDLSAVFFPVTTEALVPMVQPSPWGLDMEDAV
jgi:hypothetical protein